MKTKGRRQSTNVEDIRSQKPQLFANTGDPFPKEAIESKTPPSPDLRINYDKRGVKMAKKVGMDAMEKAAKVDRMANFDKENKKALDEAEKSAKEAGKMTNTWAMSKPKELTEIWTPRPLK